MRFTASLLGWSLDLSLSPEATADEDQGAALNGGTLASTATDVDLSPSELFMGFTNGRERMHRPRGPEVAMIATMTLTEFLLARIAEDEAKFGPEPWLDPVGMSEEWSADAGNRVLADCEAKRQIVEFCAGLIADADRNPIGYEGITAAANMAEEVLERVAAVYAEHPDYDEAWRP